VSNTAQQVVTFTGTALGMLLAALALQASHKAWNRHHDRRDLSLAWVAGVWLAHLLTSTVMDFAGDFSPSLLRLQAYSGFVSHIGYQILIVSVGFFLLTCSGITSPGFTAILVIQAAAGGAMIHLLQELLGNSWADVAKLELYQAWVAINVALGIMLVIGMAHRLVLAGSYNGWLSLAAGSIGLGLFIDGAWLADDAPHFSTFSHYCYAAFLLLIWRLVMQPDGQMARQSPADFQDSSQFEALSDFGRTPDAVVAVANERRRIAQDLHDGVCSQLVSILSSLNCAIPQQQALALALEQCLMELKMTIDATNSENDSLLDALGRLRYRVQHSLDKLGISMVWNIHMCVALEAVRGAQAQHALRITQESLANVMRHANATAVEVLCRVVPETHEMVLEVRDNGSGIARGPDGKCAGRGLEGMRRRAQEAGGKLVISSRAGKGTRVKLTLALPEHEPAPGVTEEARSAEANTYIPSQTVWH
jgi:signal transduction histidine kinase